MDKIIFVNNKIIKYDLQYKKVKNINLRIKPDGSIHVSASERVSQKVIDEFILSKADFILKALDKYANRTEKPRVQYFADIVFGYCFYFGVSQSMFKFWDWGVTGVEERGVGMAEAI